MHNVELILTLTGSLAAALLLGYVTHRLGLSPLVGYLLAGFTVGPHTPGFIANKELADQLAEVGVILLMFGVGLQFHLDELLKTWRVVVPGAVIHSLAATVLACLVAVAAGWSWPAGLVFGLAISVASTVVLLRVLADNNHLHTPAGHMAVGWLVVEDLFTVLVLVLLPVLFRSHQMGAANVALALGWSILKLVLLLVFTLRIGRRLIPWMLGHMAATHSRELFTLAVLVVALGIAVGSARLFGVSMALGAFLAGMVVGRSEFSLRAATEALPMRDAFAVLFFVSVGMLFHPAYLLEAPGLTAATLAIVLLGKPIAALLIARWQGYPPRTTLALTVGLAQIGEFSFILAALGKQLDILPDGATNALVAASIASICLNPLLYRLIDPLEKKAQRHSRIWRWLNTHAPAAAEAGQVASIEDSSGRGSRHEAIVVGYGPVGRTLARLLRENDIEPTVIELNLDTVRRLQTEGIRAVYGDALHRDTLRASGIERSIAIILTSEGMRGIKEVVRLAREANPKIRVLARTTYLRDIEALRQAGADAIFSGEGELALTMTEFVLRRLGATEEQIDRQRDRIRSELFGGSLSAKPLVDGEARPTSFLQTSFASPRAALPHPLCRLGLATRGNSGLTPDDVGHAVESGVNFLNWCGVEDGLSAFIAGLGARRAEVAVCAQFEARTAEDAKSEFEHILTQLRTDFIDVLTFYYVEEREEWRQIIGPGGALEFCMAAQREGRIRMLGATSHQRRLAAEMVANGLLDTLMIRYNAAHRGAENEIFPVTSERGLPVVVYTCLRWGALLRPTPDDPPGFVVPSAPAWYRFALQHPAVTVAVMAPENRTELDEDLQVLRRTEPLSAEEYAQLAAHGQRVRQHAGRFP